MKKLLVVFMALSLTACAGRVSTGEAAGSAVGALLGGYVGSQFAGGRAQLILIGVGALAGGMAGFNFGHELDPSDKAMLSSATRRAMATADDGQLVSWVNPLTGSAGSITPMRSYYLDRGTVCRDYQASMAVAEKIGHLRGRACRKVNGSWQIGGPV